MFTHVNSMLEAKLIRYFLLRTFTQTHVVVFSISFNSGNAEFKQNVQIFAIATSLSSAITLIPRPIVDSRACSKPS